MHEDTVPKKTEEEKPKFRRVENIEPDEVPDLEWNDDDMEDIPNDGGHEDDKVPPHLIRVGNSSNPNKLAYHIVKCIQKFGIAETQSIGPAALSKAMMAIVRAESIVSQYTTCEKLCILACIRKPTMRNGEERTAIRLRVVPVHIQYLR